MAPKLAIVFYSMYGHIRQLVRPQLRHTPPLCVMNVMMAHTHPQSLTFTLPESIR
jgi:hypothetical protein